MNISDLVGTKISSPGLFAGVNLSGSNGLWDKKALQDPGKLEVTFHVVETNVIQRNFVSRLEVRDFSKFDTASVTTPWMIIKQ